MSLERVGETARAPWEGGGAPHCGPAMPFASGGIEGAIDEADSGSV